MNLTRGKEDPPVLSKVTVIEKKKKNITPVRSPSPPSWVRKVVSVSLSHHQYHHQKTREFPSRSFDYFCLRTLTTNEDPLDHSPSRSEVESVPTSVPRPPTDVSKENKYLVL